MCSPNSSKTSNQILSWYGSVGTFRGRVCCEKQRHGRSRRSGAALSQTLSGSAQTVASAILLLQLPPRVHFEELSPPAYKDAVLLSSADSH